MAVKREKKMKHDLCLKCLWGMVGFLIIGGIYFLSSNNVDEVVIKESKTFWNFVRAVLR